MRLTALLMLVPSQAFAHAILIDSTPVPQGHVPPGHLDVSLRYNSRIDASRSKLTLVTPDHSSRRIAATGDAAPDLLKTGLDLTPGDYVIRWQVLAVDGHITRGDVPFTVTEAGAK